MKRYTLNTAVLIFAAMLFGGCWGGRFISADPDLEEVFIGKSYYEIVDDFGRPTPRCRTEWEGTKIVYNNVSLRGTAAAGLYRQYNVRNRRHQGRSA